MIIQGLHIQSMHLSQGVTCASYGTGDRDAIDFLEIVCSEPDVRGPRVFLAHGLADKRRGDVDEWGRSERTRSLARRLYDPVYRHWFRAEWEGIDKIPRHGGALIVANHAGALPSDAPRLAVPFSVRPPVT